MFAGNWVYPSVAPARRSASIARRSARSRVVETTRSGSAPTSSTLLGSTDGTATARSPSFCVAQVGSPLDRQRGRGDADHGVVAGGLISYGADLRENYRQGANYVDRILRGARPADLPVVQGAMPS